VESGCLSPFAGTDSVCEYPDDRGCRDYQCPEFKEESVPEEDPGTDRLGKSLGSGGGLDGLLFDHQADFRSNKHAVNVSERKPDFHG
jgi:hypothetical protein